MTLRILRLRDVLNLSGNSRSSHYSKITAGTWTEPVAIGPRAVGWPEAEVNALNAAAIAGKTDDEIRLLVQQLHKKRPTVFNNLVEKEAI